MWAIRRPSSCGLPKMAGLLTLPFPLYALGFSIFGEPQNRCTWRGEVCKHSGGSSPLMKCLSCSCRFHLPRGGSMGRRTHTVPPAPRPPSGDAGFRRRPPGSTVCALRPRRGRGRYAFTRFGGSVAGKTAAAGPTTAAPKWRRHDLESHCFATGSGRHGRRGTAR